MVNISFCIGRFFKKGFFKTFPEKRKAAFAGYVHMLVFY